MRSTRNNKVKGLQTNKHIVLTRNVNEIDQKHFHTCQIYYYYYQGTHINTVTHTSTTSLLASSDIAQELMAPQSINLTILLSETSNFLYALLFNGLQF